MSVRPASDDGRNLDMRAAFVSRSAPAEGCETARYSPLDQDAATRQAFLDAWAARGSAAFCDRCAELVACAEAAVDRELVRRLELVEAEGLDLRNLCVRDAALPTIAELVQLLRETA